MQVLKTHRVTMRILFSTFSSSLSDLGASICTEIARITADNVSSNIDIAAFLVILMLLSACGGSKYSGALTRRVHLFWESVLRMDL